MDFFEHQDVARKKTGRLIILFVLAVVAIVGAVTLLFAVVLNAGGDVRNQIDGTTQLGIHAAVIVGTLAIIGLGSLYKTFELRGGGRVVAESLGGTLATRSTHHARKLLNVVEEMSIAAGIPCPPVYILHDEHRINAFAAGYSPEDAVIGVTRGCVEKLSRDELQGVMAHEFSHILNGDMRLNIRLIGVLHGILMIGHIGYYLMRSASFSRRSKDGNAVGLIGIGMIVIGFTGTFFGNWIKAAVSRQREFLADASAVQFTRNPSGIADALKRIGGNAGGSGVASPNAAAASHMFFGQAIHSGLHVLFATHPPLETRIQRIEPSWNGEFLDAQKTAPPASSATPTPAKSLRDRQQDMMNAVIAGTAIAAIGQPTVDHVDRARELLDALPPVLVEAASEPWSARAVIHALLIDDDAEIRQQQFALLHNETDDAVVNLVKTLTPIASTMDTAGRLPLIEKTVTALRELSPAQYANFRSTVVGLVKADGRLGVLEWTLQRVLLHHLDAHFGHVTRPRVRYYALGQLDDECSILLSVLAYAGSRDRDDVAAAFAAGASRLGDVSTHLKPVDACRLSHLDEALETLATVAAPLKRSLITACAACVSADREITTLEAEIMRSIAESLGCPMPPMLPGQQLM